jgi:hypothetical protein
MPSQRSGGAAAYAQNLSMGSLALQPPPVAQLVGLHKLALRFADDPEYQVHLAPGGVHERMHEHMLELMLELMQLYEDHSFVQSAGAYCVGMLAKYVPNHEILASHGAIERVLFAMERFPTVQHFQQSGITALRSLAGFIGFNLNRATRAICAAMELVPASRGAARA